MSQSKKHRRKNDKLNLRPNSIQLLQFHGPGIVHAGLNRTEPSLVLLETPVFLL